MRGEISSEPPLKEYQMLDLTTCSDWVYHIPTISMKTGLTPASTTPRKKRLARMPEYVLQAGVVSMMMDQMMVSTEHTRLGWKR